MGEPATLEQQAPPRPSHEAVADALRSIAAGESFLADLLPDETDHHLQVIDLVSGWRLAIWWVRGQMGPLHAAADPAGLQWVYGCGRWPDWCAGPEAVPLDPIAHLLSDQERAALRVVLEGASCWPPALAVPPTGVPTVAELFPLDEVIETMGG